MAYLVKCALVTAKDRAGQIKYYYAGMNPVIGWMPEDQAEHLLNIGLIELLDGDYEDTDPLRDQEAVNRIEECAGAMDRLDLPRDCGAPTAREALRADGQKFGNELIASAVKLRKATAGPVLVGAVPDTAD